MATKESRVDVPNTSVERKADVDVSVVIPIIGPAQDLELLADGLASVFATMGKRHEILFVDGGSQHFEALLKIKALHPEVKIVRLTEGFEEQDALSHGFARARGAFIVTMPPYRQVEPSEIVKIVRLLDEGYDCVSGWRSPRVDPVLNRVQSATFNLITRLFTRSGFHDLNCNVRGMRRKVVEEIPIYGDNFRFLPVLAGRQGFKVIEVKLAHRQELGPKNFFGFGAYFRRVLDILNIFFEIKFRKRPLRFFGLWGTLFFFAGIAINVYLVIDWSIGWTVEGRKSLADRPLLVLGVLMMVFGFLIVSIGLIGEIIIFTHAKNLREYQVDKFLD
ncbi:MAG: glycosyltransferase [Planctomycetes bacterium]|nr:glycosyltransferase [Planctomycetota bacterium]MBI3848564.1 glycosyltransferase [Planctomycetota bacterium]